MELLTIILLLMLGLLISNVVGHYIPSIPTALTQIAFGVIVALGIGNYTFEIGAEWFLLLFVAPLLPWQPFCRPPTLLRSMALPKR